MSQSNKSYQYSCILLINKACNTVDHKGQSQFYRRSYYDHLIQKYLADNEGQISYYKVVSIDKLQLRLADCLEKFANLRAFKFYFRFRLFNYECFHRLKDALKQHPRIEEIDIKIDGQYEQDEQPGHWLSDWINKQGPKTAKYQKWDWQ